MDRVATLTPESLMQAADQAMYAAKRGGGNRFAEWVPSPDLLIPASD